MRILFIALTVIGMFSVNRINAQENSCRLKVYYFHATNRCPTCLAIEKHTVDVLREDYQEYLDNGTIIFESIDIDRDENRAIAKKHKIFSSSLLLIEIGKSEDKVNDFTDQAFSFAKDEPETFKADLINAISKIVD